jgi:hypothetical protein
MVIFGLFLPVLQAPQSPPCCQHWRFFLASFDFAHRRAVEGKAVGNVDKPIQDPKWPANVGSTITSCHVVVGSWLVLSFEPRPQRSSTISIKSRR